MRSCFLFSFSIAIFFALLGCKDTGGKVTGTVTGGVNDVTSASSYSWNFLTGSDYIYDANYVTVGGGRASLNAVNTTFNSLATFSQGTHVGTIYSGGVLKLDSSLQSALNSSWTPEYASLAAYWKMNETAANSVTGGYDVEDFSGNGNHLNETTGMTYNQTGQVDNSILFGGTGEFDATADAESLKPSRLTVSAWVYRSGTVGNSTYGILTKRFSDSANPFNSYALYIGTNAGNNLITPFFAASTGANGSQVIASKSGLSIPENQWFHLVGTYDGSYLQLYVNGVLQASSAFDGPIGYSNIPLRIGATSGQYFKGKIDEVAIWNKALKTEQVQALYFRQGQRYLNELSPAWTPHWSDLLGYWKLDNGWLDSSGNGKNASVNYGSPTFSAPGKIGDFAATFSSSARQSATTGTLSAGTEQSRTVAGWLKFASTPTTQPFRTGTLGGSVGRIWLVQYSSAGTIISNSYWGAGCDFYINSGKQFETNTWHYVAVTINRSGFFSQYIDGDLAGSASIASCASSISFATTGLTLGAYDATYLMDGSMDDFAVWSAELSASDIKLIYNRQKQKYAASYNSPVIDIGASGPWTNLKSITGLPFYKELPGNSGSESSADYSEIESNSMNGLVGLWHLNEPSTATAAGSIIDSSGNSFSATPLNVTMGSKGALGTSATFINTSGGGISVGDMSSKLSSSAISIQAWVNPSAANTKINPRIVSTWDGATYSFMISLTPSATTVRCMLCAGACATSTSTSQLDDPTKWYHVACTYDGANLKTYVNGKLEDTKTKTGSLSHLTNIVAIGNDSPDLGANSRWDGRIDEVSIWSRSLSAEEIVEFYRRGANRVKYQVRSCVDSSCACKAYSTAPAGSASDCDGDGIPNTVDTSDTYAADWIGPDGTAATYFSELQNNTNIDSSGNPLGSTQVAGLNLDWTGSLFVAAARPSNNRYFQYRVYMESDDQNNLCSSAPCLPEISSVTVGPADRYYGGSPSITNSTALSFSQLQTMTRSDSGSCSQYQLSINDGATFKWWDSAANGGTGAWATAGTTVSTANYLSDFTTERLKSLGSGNYKFKAFLNTNGDFSQSCELNSVGATYTPSTP